MSTYLLVQYSNLHEVQSYSGLLTARFFLGLTEAGVFPGMYVSTS